MLFLLSVILLVGFLVAWSAIVEGRYIVPKLKNQELAICTYYL